MTLTELNELDTATTEALFLTCCHCRRWAQEMSAARPFVSEEDVLAQAQQRWASASEPEILEAFSGHARIGDLDKLRDRYSVSHREQGQVSQASEQTLRELMTLNRDYEARHGFIFIVCASGKSAEAMRDLLAARINNSRDQELHNGAREQAAITALRLHALFSNDKPHTLIEEKESDHE